MTCPTCGEHLLSGPDIEEAEEKIAVQLMNADRRDGEAVRFMLTNFGVYIDEILLRYPAVDRETVKGWRKSLSPVPDEISDWAHSVVRAGGLSDQCLCGECD